VVEKKKRGFQAKKKGGGLGYAAHLWGTLKEGAGRRKGEMISQVWLYHQIVFHKKKAREGLQPAIYGDPGGAGDRGGPGA